MADEDVDHWFDALAGRKPAAAESGLAAQEARKLREALLLCAVPAEQPVPVPDATREAALLKRAEREGLIPARGHDWSKWYAAAFRTPAMIAYAALACVAVAVTLLMRPPAAIEAVRGAHDGVVRVEVTDPLAFKRQFIDELSQAGVTATGYERLGRQGIDADLPQPVSAQVRAMLQRHHMDVPADGVLKIEVIRISTP
jgi:hypothetical protein